VQCKIKANNTTVWNSFHRIDYCGLAMATYCSSCDSFASLPHLCLQSWGVIHERLQM